MDATTIQNLEIDPMKLQQARGTRSPSVVARTLGITYQQLWAIETGLRRPSAPVFIRLCFLYDVVDVRTLVSSGGNIKDIPSGEIFLQTA